MGNPAEEEKLEALEHDVDSHQQESEGDSESPMTVIEEPSEQFEQPSQIEETKESEQPSQIEETKESEQSSQIEETKESEQSSDIEGTKDLEPSPSEEEEQLELQVIEEQPAEEKKTFCLVYYAKNLKPALKKTRNSFTSKVNDLVARYRKVDEDFFEELEDLLLQADVGFETVMELMDKLRFEVQRKNIKDTNGIQTLISEKLVEIYEQGEEDLIELNMQPDGELTVILFVGVNGVGKTTTIGKLAHRLKSQGKTVVLAAGDTFRAGAIDQLQVWGDRVGCEVIKQSEGSDPAAVMYDAIRAAKNRKADVLICDTAGRLQNKVNLMNELEKSTSCHFP
ncbi:signal recognition particle-docking protein FtsY [Lysinibacillus sp. MHQ-1]|nr:signal recognition particle-docking protein FtsY [Lysinibacillus sp. MHQ-1]